MAKRNRKIVNLEDIKDFKKYKSMMQPDLIKKDLIRSLAREGKRLISAAYATRTYEKRTGYLHDSYVSAVFDNGVLLPKTIRFLDARQHKMPPRATMSAEDAAKLFLSKYQFAKGRKGGLALVVAAAAWYSGILEGRGYRVISHIYSEMENIKRFGIDGDGLVSYYGDNVFDGAFIRYDKDFERITQVTGGGR